VEAKVNSGSLSSGATGGRLPELSSWCKREEEGEREGGRGEREAVEAETRGREGTYEDGGRRGGDPPLDPSLYSGTGHREPVVAFACPGIA
jgi:hypothetical protein